MTETENPYLGQILLFRGRGIISRLIRWQTRGEFSHVAIRVGKDECIEAWPGAGVRLKRITDWSGIRVFVPIVPQRAKIIAVSYAAQQIGKQYDFLGVLRFVSRRRRDNPGRWFCSELVFASFQHANWELLARSEPWEISPAGLSRSPMLVEVERA